MVRLNASWTKHILPTVIAVIACYCSDKVQCSNVLYLCDTGIILQNDF